MKHLLAALALLSLPMAAAAQIPISALPSATTPLAGTEVVPIVQSSSTKRAAVSSFITPALVSAGLGYAPAHPGNNADITSLNVTASASAYPNNWFNNGSGGITASTVHISYLNDREFMGAATVNNGQFGNTADWLSQIAGDPAGIVQVCQLCIETTNGLVAVVGGSQALNTQAATSPVLGASFYAQADRVGATNPTWGLYAEGRMVTYNGTNHGSTAGAEFDAVNFSGSTTTTATPYFPYPTNYTVDLQLAAGGSLTGANLKPTSMAVNIANNGTTHDVGINFDSTALSGNNGTTGSGTAIAMPKGDALVWFDPTNTGSGLIISDASTHATGAQIRLFDGGVNFANSAALNSVQLQVVNSAVNQINVFGSATTNPVGLSATGSDTNIDITLSPKGTGGNLRSTTGVLAATVLGSGVYAFASLPSCAAGQDGQRAMVNNSNVAASGNFGAAVAGGGANHVPVYCDGGSSVWRIG